jgi:hypothetical protein
VDKTEAVQKLRSEIDRTVMEGRVEFVCVATVVWWDSLPQDMHYELIGDLCAGHYTDDPSTLEMLTWVAGFNSGPLDISVPAFRKLVSMYLEDRDSDLSAARYIRHLWDNVGKE